MRYFAVIGADGVVKNAIRHIGPPSEGHGLTEIGEADFNAVVSGLVVRHVATGKYVHEPRIHTRAELRRSEYPPIGDQLDALWKGGDAAEAMRLMILSVKERHP